MTDLVKRLRRYRLQEGDGETGGHLAELIADLHWAADEIERLRKGWESLEWESKQEIERLEARCLKLYNANEKQGERIAELERLEAALRQIAANTCCAPCQEARLVARAALEQEDE
jgi:hypothetical protein